MFKNIILQIKDNKNYLIGLILSVIIPLCIMLIYWNKSVSNYDGWYNLYAQDILDGRIPYRDFHFLMPPIFLYAWTLLQKVFGNYIIVFHVASVVCKCLFAGTIYHTFTRFFNYKISLIGSLTSAIVMLVACFDNCTFSYNEFVSLICIILINIFISFTDKLYKDNKVSNLYVIFLALINTILFFTKQTHGIVVPCGFFVLFTILILVKTDLKTYLKALGIYILTSLFTAIIICLPLLHSEFVSSYIQNVFGGTSAKGTIISILALPLKLVSEYMYIWPVFIVGCGIFVMYVLKKYSVVNSMQTKEKDEPSKYIPNMLIIFLCCIMSIICAVLFNKIFACKYHLLQIIPNVDRIINQMGAISQYVTFFTALFYFIRFLVTKDNHDAKRMILFSILIMMAISIAFSRATLYDSYYLYGAVVALLLNYKSKILPFFEILSIFLIIALTFLITEMKLVRPFAFHGYWSLNIETERKISKLHSLKGFKLSKQEVDIYEDLYDTINKYLDSNDKIFTFINNTLFYNLLGRKPFYNDYYNLYWDVSPDKDAKVIYDQLNTDVLDALPKAIIYFENPEWNIVLHEKFFRKGNKNNFQRKIDVLMKRKIISDEYIVVKNFNSEDFYKNNSKISAAYKILNTKKNDLENLYKEYNYDKNFDINKYNKISDLENEISVYKKQIKHKSSDLDRYFLDDGFNLKLLIRKDIYEKNKEE